MTNWQTENFIQVKALTNTQDKFPPNKKLHKISRIIYANTIK